MQTAKFIVLASDAEASTTFFRSVYDSLAEAINRLSLPPAPTEFYEHLFLPAKSLDSYSTVIEVYGPKSDLFSFRSTMKTMFNNLDGLILLIDGQNPGEGLATFASLGELAPPPPRRYGIIYGGLSALTRPKFETSEWNSDHLFRVDLPAPDKALDALEAITQLALGPMVGALSQIEILRR